MTENTLPIKVAFVSQVTNVCQYPLYYWGERGKGTIVVMRCLAQEHSRIQSVTQTFSCEVKRTAH